MACSTVRWNLRTPTRRRRAADVGGKSSSKTKISRYHMSQWWGVAMKVDAVLAVDYGEKTMWSGRITDTQTVSISNENLYGGDKKEGGVKGRMTILMGDSQQVMPTALARRLGQQTSDYVPGFRGVTSLFFTGTGGGTVTGYNGKSVIGNQYGVDVHDIIGGASVWDWAFGRVDAKSVIAASAGFYWTANSPYLKQLAVTVERIPRQLDPATAKIIRNGSNQDKKVYRSFSSGVGTAGVDSLWDQTLTLPLSPSAEPLTAGLSVVISQYSSADNDGGNAPNNPIRVQILSLSDAVLLDSGWFGYSGFPSDQSTLNTVLVSAGRSDLIGAISASMSFSAVLPESSANVKVRFYCGTFRKGITDAITEIADPGFDNRVWDANPAHIIYECLTDTSWGLGEDVANIDVAAFVSVAQTLYNENFGLSLVWDAASAIEDFVNNILSHINGVIFTHPATGLLTIRLVRDDYDRETVREINPDNALLTKFSRKAWGDTINEIQVTWTDPADEDASKVILQDAGNIAQQGFINSSNSDYPGVRTVALAGKLAERDLRAASSPLCTGEATANRTFFDATPMEVLKLNWPEYGVEAVYARVTSVTYGELGASGISLTLAEDIFGYPQAEYTAASGGSSNWTPSNPGEGGVLGSYVMPAPYYGLAAVLGADSGTIDPPTTYNTPLAATETGEASTYDLYASTTLPSGGTEYQMVDDDRPFMLKSALPAALVGEAVSTITGLTAAVNDVLIIGAPGLGAASQELALVAAVDGSTGALTVWRGIIDSTPKAWANGTEVWIGGIEHLSAEPTARTEGATASYKMLPSWSDATLDSLPVVAFSGVARASRPYPPANVKIGGTDAFAVTSATGAFAVTWAHRNKETQAENILKQTDASVTPEADVRYGLRIRNASNTVLVERSDIAGATATVDLTYTGAIKIELWAIDDNGASFQSQVRSLAYTAGTATANTITASGYTPPVDTIIIDGGEIT